MSTVGEQIVAARKAKGMTQDALSKVLNISRSAVAHWETGRTLPDAKMLIQLSKALDYSFAEEKPVAPAADPQSAELSLGQAPAASDSPAETVPADAAPAGDEADEIPAGPIIYQGGYLWRRKGIVIAAALVLALCALILPRALRRDGSPAQYTADDGSVYTIEQFQQSATREDGKAWLLGEKGFRIISADGGDVWMYEFAFHEMNGVALSIDRLEVCTFFGDRALPMIISGESLPLYGLESAIAPLGDWSETGGLPVSDNVKGVGIALYCTDEAGAAEVFSDYLPLSAAK